MPFNNTITYIVVFFLLRLIFTIQPPIEYQHTWRQSTGLMFARNFVETDASFIHPRIDDNAGGSGILVLEAPVMYYGMYLLSIPFGYQDWYGRLINLIVSSLGLYFFFLLVQRFFTERVAFYATLILTTSLWLIFSRKTMQDTFAVSLVFMGLYCSFQYFDRGRWGPLMCYIVLTTLGILSKIPAGMYLLFPILYLIRNPVPRKRMVGWGIGTLAPLILSYLWYFVYAPYASERYGYWHNLGEPLRDGLRSLVQNMDHVAENFFFQSFHSFVFIGALLMYWVMIIRRKERKHLICFREFYAGVRCIYDSQRNLFCPAQLLYDTVHSGNGGDDCQGADTSAKSKMVSFLISTWHGGGGGLGRPRFHRFSPRSI